MQSPENAISLTLNHRVPGSSPGAPTTQSAVLAFCRDCRERPAIRFPFRARFRLFEVSCAALCYGLRSRKCGNFDPWSPVPKFPFLARFRLFEMNCAAPWFEVTGVSFLSGGSGRLDTRLDTPPSIKRRHPDSRIAPAFKAEASLWRRRS